MGKTLQGVMPPIITPFQKDELDLAALRQCIAKWNPTGLAGYLVLGSNGEAPYLDDAEREEIMSLVREEALPGMVLMAGTGRESTKSTIMSTARAAYSGADFALVLTPAYFKAQLTPARLEAHYRKVAGEAPIPILLYNFPQATGVNLASGLVARLAEHPNIAGIKDSSGNIAQLSEIIRLTPDDFAVFVGNAEVFYSGLGLGACGGILAVANVLPALCVDLAQAAAQGDHQSAKELQWRLSRLASLVTRIHGVGGLKAAMELAGYPAGNVRSPLTMPDSQAKTEIEAALEEALA